MLRFPGQYYDQESGLHYNRHRYYDPETAQYLTPDPLGLEGGVRPQAYVDNPNAWIDPLGLAACPTALMRSRLERMGYDQTNTTRIMDAIKNGGRVVIVGENMRRVNAVAGMVESAGGRPVTYNPRNWSGMNRNSLEANRSWIRYWAKDKGATIIDIGRQPTPRPYGPSPFYGIENRSLRRWGVYTPFDG